MPGRLKVLRQRVTLALDKLYAKQPKAEMSATDGVNGDSFEGAIQVAPGIWVYQLTTKGLSMSLALKGTNYYRDKEMNGDKK